MDGQVVFFPGFSGFRPPLMNDWLDISEIFLKRPLNPNQKKKKKIINLSWIIKCLFLRNMEPLMSAEYCKKKKKVLRVNPSLAEHDMPCLSKHCRARSVGF